VPSSRPGADMKQVRIGLAALAGAALVLFLAVELLLRAMGYSYPRWYQPDPQLGWVLRPGVSGWFTGEGRSFVQINSAGQRDRERPMEKPEGVYRIAVLGDAYAEAMQVPLEDTYWAQLPGRLESCGFQPGKRIEVLNFGVRDYGTAQAYLVLQNSAVRYRPDLVLLQFDNGNDVRDNSRALDGIRGRPYFTLDEQGRLRLDDSFTSDEAYRRRTSLASRAFRVLADGSRTLQLLRRVPEMPLMSSAHAKRNGNEAGLEVKTLAAPTDRLWEEAWRVSEALITKVAEFASAHGAKVAVVTVPFAMEVHPDAAWRERIQQKYGVPDLAYPDRRVASFARDKGMLAIMLAPEMKALAARTGSYLYGYENRELGFGHWNHHGHRAVADIIARALCANRSW
jgi:hypothetical protein